MLTVKINQWHAVRKYMLHDYQKCYFTKKEEVFGHHK